MPASTVVIITMSPDTLGQQFVVRIKAYYSDNEKNAGVVNVASTQGASMDCTTNGSVKIDSL